jgi:hypothetical protein
MAGNIKDAQALITGMNGKLDRSAVVRWAAIKNKATGREREAISWMAEAFGPMTKTEEDRRWLSSFLSGIPESAPKKSTRGDGVGHQSPGDRLAELETRIDAVSKANGSRPPLQQ